MRKPMLKAENQSYRLDRETGRLRIPIRGTEGVQVHLPLSEWHRTFLSDSSWKLGSLTVVPGRIILVVRRERPKAYESEGAIALDTNEDSFGRGIGLRCGHGLDEPAFWRRTANPANPLPTTKAACSEESP